MKVISVIIALVAVVIVFLYITVMPSLTSLFDCYDRLDPILEKNLILAKKEAWDKQRICVEGRKMALELSKCFSLVEQKGILSNEIIFKIAKLIKPGFSGISSDKRAIELHNSTCSDFPETLIK